jgi:hypothetical protein
MNCNKEEMDQLNAFVGAVIQRELAALPEDGPRIPIGDIFNPHKSPRALVTVRDRITWILRECVDCRGRMNKRTYHYHHEGARETGAKPISTLDLGELLGVDHTAIRLRLHRERNHRDEARRALETASRDA